MNTDPTRERSLLLLTKVAEILGSLVNGVTPPPDDLYRLEVEVDSFLFNNLRAHPETTFERLPQSSIFSFPGKDQTFVKMKNEVLTVFIGKGAVVSFSVGKKQPTPPPFAKVIFKDVFPSRM